VGGWQLQGLAPEKTRAARSVKAEQDITRTVCVTGRYGRRRITAAGFRIQERLDFLPFYAMWRVTYCVRGSV
jgi:hypothetical protein